MKKIKLIFYIMIIILSLTCLISFSMASQERLINFQGRLTDQQGNVLDGTYKIKFSIYPSDPNAGSLWIEEHMAVSVNNGIVNVLLGSITSFDVPMKVTFDEERYLGITIDCDHDPNTTDPEMTPRQRILPAIYSYNADKLDGKDSSEYTTPQTDAGRPGVVENLYEGNIRLMDKYIKQADLGNKGCYVSYSGPDCLPGFENKGSLGTYGICRLRDKNDINWNGDASQAFFVPPGTHCGYSISIDSGHPESIPTRKIEWHEAWLCCQ
ncbi:MAG: hypothetical protein ACMUHX_11045 [bacterium]